MSLTPSQQFRELLKKADHALILLPAFPSLDAIATAFALALSLEERGARATVCGERLLIESEPLSFLSLPQDRRDVLSGVRDFVLSFNTEHNPIVDVRTERAPGELRIYLTPEQGAIDPRDFSFVPARFAFDLAIVVGAPDKEHLGTAYEHNPDIFYEMPVVNLDNESGNEMFGQVNLVEMTASSCAEIAAGVLLEEEKGDRMSEPVANALLSGIIAATESFQKKNTTPKALRLASLLMQAGADQQKIVRKLYKTQPLHLLKLWGKAMAGVRYNEELKMVWSLIRIEDLVHARAKAEELPAVLDKIKSNYTSAQIFALLSPETRDRVRVLMKAQSAEILATLAPLFPESELRGETLSFSLEAPSLETAEEKLFEKMTPK